MLGGFEALLSFITRQVGLRTDAANPTGSLHAKVGATKNVVDNINTNTVYGTRPRCLVASDTLRLSADAEIASSDIDNTGGVRKRIWVSTPGTVRIRFDLKTTGGTAYAEVWVNGIRILRTSTSSTAYVTYTFDKPIPPGAYIDFRLWVSNSSYCAYARNFRIYYNVANAIVEGVTVENNARI